jgi:hypothetical protein
MLNSLFLSILTIFGGAGLSITFSFNNAALLKFGIDRMIFPAASNVAPSGVLQDAGKRRTNRAACFSCFFLGVDAQPATKKIAVINDAKFAILPRFMMTPFYLL